MREESNGRTHEPNLRELTAELDGLRDLMESSVESVSQKMDERDRRYEDRFRAMDEKTSLALAGSEKAVTKAEIATEKRFDAVNEFRGTLSDQAANLMPRGEANAKFMGLEDKFTTLRDDVTRVISTGTGSKLIKDESRANIALVVSALTFLTALVLIILRVSGH